MFKNAKKLQLSSLTLLLLMSATYSQAVPIEGGTEKALHENKDLLNSVIKLQTGAFFDKGTCSSTLISKNILLTALHCVEEIKPGTTITLNNNPHYRAVQVIGQRAMITQVRGEDVSTDIALILFKVEECKQSSLAEITPVPLANHTNKMSLSNRVLLAGYGETRFGLGDTGTLHAGYNEWMVSDYSQVKNPALVPGMKEFIKNKIETAENQLVMGGGRTEMIWFKNTAGKKLSEVIRGATLVRKESAIDLPGDSGGSAFAFDPSGNPFIVGVTSEVVENARPRDSRLLAINSKNEILASVVVLAREKGLSEASQQMHSELLKSKIINSSDIALIDFQILSLRYRLAYGMYASTSNPINEDFIQGSLKKLENIRDQSANFCQ